MTTPPQDGEGLVSDDMLKRADVAATAACGIALPVAGLSAALAAVAPDIAAAAYERGRADGAAEERERTTYRDPSGEVLHCPRCGASDPEGYTRAVLDS